MVSIVTENSLPRDITAGTKLVQPKPGDEVVISGLSGKFPESDNVYEFRDQLFDKTDMVTDDDRRWKLDHMEIPKRGGKLKTVNKFDASFFGVHAKQAHAMDPMGRLLLERAYEAVVDAGINPRQLRGTRCGVFVGVAVSESATTSDRNKTHTNGLGMTGCARTMLANRISFWLGINGPSYTIDTACSSSLYALEHAYKSIRDGHCDSALVGGCHLCLHPHTTLSFSRLGALSLDGRCKAFDDSANGYCRSEAIVMTFLQRAKDAKRIYATVVHALTNCDGYKEEGITYPSEQIQFQLLRDFYTQCGIDPTTVDYVEAHGTGTKAGDLVECNSLDRIFCKGRKNPLWIGSVKSNMGHSEPASGLCGVTKVIMAMESGFIPPNLHYSTPREGIHGLHEGRMKVVTEKLAWAGGLVGINGFGFGGANCHVLLKWNEKEKNNEETSKNHIPKLVVASGRTQEAVQIILDELESKPIDLELVNLLHEVHSQEITGHMYRGFTVLSDKESKCRDIQYSPNGKRKIWFVFSGLGSQWPGMATSLLQLPVFEAAIIKCNRVLMQKGLDLMRILTEEEPQTFQNIMHCFVGITAVQIGLVDVLYSIGIHPDNMIGHSIGELGCAYADGCLTVEQAILSAYYRGLACLESNLIPGSMAAVGMGYQNIKNSLPADIDVACHNGPDSCTLSGPADAMKKFVSQLTEKGVFAREVPCSGVPCHSRYIQKAGPTLLNYLQEVIPNPKPRSTKWISSFLPESKWNTSLAKNSSAEYHVNNFLSPVLFEEACTYIPGNVITIEIAPHGLLQAILKRSLKKGVTNLPLTLRGHTENLQFFLTSIGKLYELGLEVDLAKLYPPVQYPVSRGTSMISPLVRWDHSEDWHVISHSFVDKIISGERTVSISLNDEQMEYLVGHNLDGRNLFPATGYLVLVWETVAMMRGELYTQVPVVFENLKLSRATTIPKDGSVDFTIMVQKGSGQFEVIEGGAAIVTGRIFVPENVDKEKAQLGRTNQEESDNLIPLNAKDIYKELRLRGYNYSGPFKGLVRMNNKCDTGMNNWMNNFVTFMDGMCHLHILDRDNRSLYVPTAASKIVIDPKQQSQVLSCLPDGQKVLPVSYYKHNNIIMSGGVEIHGLESSQISRRKPLTEPVIGTYSFVPHMTAHGTHGTHVNQSLDMDNAVRLCVHLALENTQGHIIKVVEICDETVKPESVLFAPIVSVLLGDMPLLQGEVKVLTPPNNPKTTDLDGSISVQDTEITAEQNCSIIIASNLLQNPRLLHRCLKSLKQKGFLILRESPRKLLPLGGFHVLVDREVNGERILMLKKVQQGTAASQTVLKISDEGDFDWIPELQSCMVNPNVQSIILVAEGEKTNGLLGFVRCLRTELDGERIRCVLILDDAPPFDVNDPFYSSHLSKGLAVNILKGGQWGSYRHQRYPPPPPVSLEHVYWNTSVRGDLSSFKSYEGPINVNQHWLEPGKNITVYYSSINFRDVMLATGKLSRDAATPQRLHQENVIGCEFSGRDSRTGRRVMGLVPQGGLTSLLGKTQVTKMIWQVPEEWSLEEAATVPLVYGTVFSALVVNGQVRKGESILIHSGTGGVGLAAIHVALYFDCKVFVTVGTPEKREYILKNFPQIKDNQIGNSRDTSFQLMIETETGGRGVDLVLNSLSEEKLQASLKCLAKGGRFLEIGKFDLANNNPIGLGVFQNSTSFHGVMLDNLFTASEDEQNEFAEMMKRALATGAVKPLKRTVYDVQEVEQAFRYMTTGKHMGKVLLKWRDEEEQKIALPSPKTFQAETRFFASDNKTYIIVGGLGGIGLELADWLILRGARKIVLTSRTGVTTGYQSMHIRLWRSHGAQILISTQDITTRQGVTNLIQEAQALGPVDGIFNLAAVLRDAIFENQTQENFRISFAPKAKATKLLDELTRRLCPNLKYFVVFSSTSSSWGNIGVSNYGMSNSVMDRICESRVEDGYPGLAIQWGAIADVGLLAEKQEEQKDLVVMGTYPQSIPSCLQHLDLFLKQKHPIVSCMVVAEKKSARPGSSGIVDTVRDIMGIRDLKMISLNSSLPDLGMDSMTAIEIKQTLEREFELFLTAQEIRGLSLANLAELEAKNKESLPQRANQSESVTKPLTDENVPGLGIILLRVGDELTAPKPLIGLNSQSGDSFANMCAPTASKPPVIFIPGLDGMASSFTSLAKNIRSPTVSLQLPYDSKDNTDLSQIAINLQAALTSYLGCGIQYTLVGYSMGAVIALELVSLLEAKGHLGKLVLIDGSPDFLDILISTVVGGFSDENIDNKILHTISNITIDGDNERIMEEVKKYQTWDQKLECFLSLFPTSVLRNKIHSRIIANDLHRRLKAGLNYKSSLTRKISSQVTLIRPGHQVLLNILPEDYALSKYCKTPVDIHFVDGNHVTILDNKQVAQIINKVVGNEKRQIRLNNVHQSG